MRPPFEVQPDVHRNVVQLRHALGSATRALSQADLAELLNAKDGGTRGQSTIRNWEKGTEPDLQSIRLMAELAECSFEEFALGLPPRGRRGLTEAEVLAAEKSGRRKKA